MTKMAKMEMHCVQNRICKLFFFFRFCVALSLTALAIVSHSSMVVFNACDAQFYVGTLIEMSQENLIDAHNILICIICIQPM